MVLYGDVYAKIELPKSVSDLDLVAIAGYYVPELSSLPIAASQNQPE
jgi:hypothetical protein